MSPLTPAELRQRAVSLSLIWGDGPEDRRVASELLAALANWDPVLLWRASLGDAGHGPSGRDLLFAALEAAAAARS
jgi:hypothetical protein